MMNSESKSLWRPALHSPRILPMILALCLPCVALAQTRYHEYSQRFDNPAHPAQPIAAGYLGGNGDEYLMAGAFLPDASLLLAGNAFGPQLLLAGQNVPVLGVDSPAPVFSMPFQPDKDKTKPPTIRPPNWTYSDSAAFVVKLDPGCRRIVASVRFPWSAAVLTDLSTDDAGNIYVTGIVGPRFQQLGPSIALPDAFPEPDRVFLARLAPDLRRLEWSVTFSDDKRQPPKLSILENGIISLIAKNAYHFRPNGERVQSTQHDYSADFCRAIHPLTHAMARGRDHNTRTGWEPWRRPLLEIHDAQKAHTDTFYQWDAAFVGTNWSRLISDSDVRLLSYDNHGHLLMVGWSDGGNTVFEYMPYDIRKGVQDGVRQRTGGSSGLGFSTWGANVGSFMHIVKMDTEEVGVLAKTLFCSYLPTQNKPNSISLNTIRAASDNSILLGGGSANGLIETRNTKLNTLRPEAGDYMGGNFVAVLNERMNDIRFSSALPGAGVVALDAVTGRSTSAFAAHSRDIQGKTHVVFVSSAQKHEKFKPLNPLQNGFGGGSIDGMYVVVTMDALPSPKAPAAAVPPLQDPPSRAKSKPDPELPAGTFQVTEKMRNPAAIVTMRDSTQRRWPLYYLAKPQGQGQITTGTFSGRFNLLGPGNAVQLRQGKRQELRLAGNLVQAVDGGNVYPDIALAVTLLARNRVQADMTFNGRRLRMEGDARIEPAKPNGPGLQISGTFRSTKSALGLDKRDPNDANDEVIIEFWVPARP